MQDKYNTVTYLILKELKEDKEIYYSHERTVINSILRSQFPEQAFTQKDILLKAMKEIAIGECFVGNAQNRKSIVSNIAFAAIKEVEALDDRP